MLAVLVGDSEVEIVNGTGGARLDGGEVAERERRPVMPVSFWP